jgi:hypothetical protein
MNRPMWEPRANWYYIRGPNFTCGVVELDGIIVEAAPILRRFLKQPLGNLKRWIERLGGSVNRL